MAKTKDSCDVRSCFLCQGCLPDWLQVVAINKKNLHYKRGETIFTEGQPVLGSKYLQQAGLL